MRKAARSVSGFFARGLGMSLAVVLSAWSGAALAQGSTIKIATATLNAR